MIADVCILIKRMNLQQSYKFDDSDGCNFRRSYAFRRKTRPSFQVSRKRVKNARKNFDRCIERCGILDRDKTNRYQFWNYFPCKNIEEIEQISTDSWNKSEKIYRLSWMVQTMPKYLWIKKRICLVIIISSRFLFIFRSFSNIF